MKVSIYSPVKPLKRSTLSLAWLLTYRFPSGPKTIPDGFCRSPP
jgi:hypothetical protein